MEMTKKQSDRQFIKTAEHNDKIVLARKTPKPKFPNLQLLFAWELLKTTPLNFSDIANLTRCFFDLHGSVEGIPLKRIRGFFAGKFLFTPLEFFILATCYGYNVAKPATQYEDLWPHERPFKLKLPTTKPHKKVASSVA